MGGVVALQRSHIMAMNGFSNQFFGWGAEDDDLAQRIQQLGFTLTRFDPAVASYITLSHQRETPAQDRFTTLSQAKESMKKDGLNSLNYKVIEREDRSLYTWLLVSCWGCLETVKWYSKLSLYTVAHRHAEDSYTFISITMVLCVLPSVVVHCTELGPRLLMNTKSPHTAHYTLITSRVQWELTAVSCTFQCFSKISLLSHCILLYTDHSSFSWTQLLSACVLNGAIYLHLGIIFLCTPRLGWNRTWSSRKETHDCVNVDM